MPHSDGQNETEKRWWLLSGGQGKPPEEGTLAAN